MGCFLLQVVHIEFKFSCQKFLFLPHVFNSLQHVFTFDIEGACFISDSLRSSPQDNSELQEIHWGKMPVKEIRTWAGVGDERLQIIIEFQYILREKRWIHSTSERQVPIPAFSRTPTDPEPSIALYSSCVCVCVCVCVHMRVACSVMSNSVQHHGLWPTRPLCPLDFPGKNTGVGCHFLLQGIFLT